MTEEDPAQGRLHAPSIRPRRILVVIFLIIFGALALMSLTDLVIGLAQGALFFILGGIIDH
ncbi:hypothetical protein [Streptomyces sp. NPDC101165]|uniref:hypothetical protein n=1 Tax=Streptomyces sp. NPDC101165 TaxID=3366119 RepID=UPI00380ED78D